MAWYDYFLGGAKGGWGYMEDQASKGYNTAAGGARDASNQARDFSAEQWRRMMEGLSGAKGSMAPSGALWQQLYKDPGADRGPGELKQWWDNNNHKFGDPRKTTGVFNSFNEYMGNPSMVTGVFGDAKDTLGRPSATSGAYDLIKGQLGQDSKVSGAYGDQRKNFLNQGGGEDFFNLTRANYTQPSNSMTFYNNFMGELGNAGRSEGYRPNMGQQDAYNQKADQLYSGLQGPGYTDRGAAEVGGYFRGADDVAQYAGRNLGQLEQEGTFEQWAKSALMGDNPELERERQKGLAQVNQEMARRGHFNSGGAGTAIGNYIAEQNAKEFAQKSDLAAGAQQMQMQRLGQGQGLAEGSAGNKMGIGSSLQSLFGQQDTQKMGRDSLAAQIAKSQADQDLNAQSLTMQANRDADAAKLARLQGLQGMAGQADNTTLANLTAGQDAAFRAQEMVRQRALDDISSANTVDKTSLERLMAQLAGAQGKDSTELERLTSLFGMAGGVDQSVMDRYGLAGKLAGQDDSLNLEYLLGAGGLAGATDRSELDRIESQNKEKKDAFDARFGIDKQISDLHKTFYGEGGRLSGDAMSDAINAGANAAQLEGMGENAEGELPYKIGGTLLDVSRGAQTLDGGIEPPAPPPPGIEPPAPPPPPSAMNMTELLGGGRTSAGGTPQDMAYSLANDPYMRDLAQSTPGGYDALMDMYYEMMGLTNPNKRRRMG